MFFHIMEVPMKTIKHVVFYGVAIGVSIFVLLFFVASSWIGYDVKNHCQNAKYKYGGDCVEALTAQLEDTNEGFRARNHAIWALGQLGDNRALPVLKRYYTAVIPDREPLDEVISQYELKKAVNLTSGGTNLTAFLWRGIFKTK